MDDKSQITEDKNKGQIEVKKEDGEKEDSIKIKSPVPSKEKMVKKKTKEKKVLFSSYSINKRVIFSSFLSAFLGIAIITCLSIYHNLTAAIENVKISNQALVNTISVISSETLEKKQGDFQETDLVDLLGSLNKLKKTRLFDKDNLFLYYQDILENRIKEYSWNAAGKKWDSRGVNPDLDYYSIIKDVLVNQAQLERDMLIYKKLSLSQDDFISAFAPLKGKEQQVIGVFMIKKNMRENQKEVAYNILFIFGASLFGLLIAFFIGFKIARNITEPILQVVDNLKKISSRDADLTSRFNYTQTDEIGELGRSFDKFTQILQSIILEMINMAKPINKMVNDMDELFNELADSSHSQSASIEEATAGNEELTSSIKNISETASEQISLLEANMPELDSLIQFIFMVEKNATKVNDLSTSALLSSNQGKEIIQDMVQEMRVLDESSEKIAKIINIVRDVADQTRLLSLNAAIEAARAKEHGKGFAVVADEVSTLAEKTAEQVKSVTGIIRENNEHISKALRFVERSEQSFLEISSFVEEATSMSGKNVEGAKQKQKPAKESLAKLRDIANLSQIVASSMKEQAINADEMAHTVESINTFTQKTTEVVDDLKQRFGKVKNLYGDMQFLLRQFKVN